MFVCICNSIQCQQSFYALSVIVGPNITNVVQRNNTVPISASFPPRSYQSINFLAGCKLYKRINERSGVALSVNYEKIRSASGGFNNRFKPVIDERIHYLGSSLEYVFKPLKGSGVSFGIGPFMYFALNKRIGDDDLFLFRRLSFGPITNIEFPISSDFSFRIGTLYAVSNLRKSNIVVVSGQPNPVRRATKPYSFQFTLSYNFKSF